MCLDDNIPSLKLLEKISSKQWTIRSGVPEEGPGCADKLGRHQSGDELQPQVTTTRLSGRSLVQEERETRWPGLTAEGRERPGAAQTGSCHRGPEASRVGTFSKRMTRALEGGVQLSRGPWVAFPRALRGELWAEAGCPQLQSGQMPLSGPGRRSLQRLPGSSASAPLPRVPTASPAASHPASSASGPGRA